MKLCGASVLIGLLFAPVLPAGAASAKGSDPIAGHWKWAEGITVDIFPDGRLNAHFRGQDAATNVLSFPARALPGLTAHGPRPLGDLVICARLLRREARAQGKTLRAHWAHLVVHGALHLIGYDHQRARDARRMERREIAVLRRLGFANPYRSV